MKKIYIYTLSTLLLWGVASCKKPNDFGTTNNDPTAVTKPVISALIADVEKNLPQYVSTQSYAINGGAYAQYFSETQYPGTSLYDLPQVDFTPQYGGTHDGNTPPLPIQAGNLYDCQNVIDNATNKNSVAAATIMQQFIYWTLTDAFGDIPYSQALQGIKAITPAYDKQEDIYKGILSKTAAAVASLNGAVEGDVVYGGDPVKWKQFGNSLIILASIQLSKQTAATTYASAAFKTAVAGGYIASNADNFAPGFTADYHNPWFALYDGRTDWAQSNTMTNMTTALNDGRSLVWGGAFNDPGQVTGGTVTSSDGVPYGLARTDANNYIAAHPDWSLVLRADKRTPATPVVVIGAAQVTLAIAEGINIGWTTGDANATYQHGIALSFEQWGVAAPSAVYLNQAAVKFSSTSLATQQWLASYPNGHMGWNIWRKTGIPALTAAPGGQGKPIVRRFVYSSTEGQTNGANNKAAVAREVGAHPGIDSQDNAVWWDVIGQGAH